MKRIVIYTKANADLIEDVCEFLYSDKGVQSVHDLATILYLDYAHCGKCEANNPIISTDTYSSCAVCGNNIEL